MKTKKENAPILEQVIQRLEKEQKKEVFIKKIGLIIYVLLLLVWSWYFGSLLYLSCKIREGELNLWIQSPFQIALFLSALVFFGSYLRNKIASKKREELLTAIKDLKGYLERYHEIPALSIAVLSKLSNKLPSLFWDFFLDDIFSLHREQKEEYVKKINELEERISHL